MRLLLLLLVVSVTSSGARAGEAKIVGLSEDELISCAGFPAGQMQLNGKTFYKFSSTSEGGAAFPAGGIVLFGRHQNGCEATVGVENGRVVHGALLNVRFPRVAILNPFVYYPDAVLFLPDAN